jgi:tetratricopeptide (TPR) repeat protein
MKKRLTLFVCGALLSVCAHAQTNNASSSKSTKQPSAGAPSLHLSVYEQAMQASDASTAILALNYYLIEQGKNSVYSDTLAMLYMQQGAYTQAYYWANLRLEQTPQNDNLAELKGLALDKLQQPKEAITVFEKLFAKTRNPYHGYKLMEMQYGIKRLQECLATAEATEKLPFKPEFLMTYTFGEQVGRTYLQAGVHNIHALALYDLDRKDEARQFFQKALSLDSSFALAKQNLEAVNALAQAKAQPEVTPAGKSVPNASPANKQN